MFGVLLRKTKSFLRLPWPAKWLFAEAILTTAYVKITLLFLPFRKVAGWLGGSGQFSADSFSNDQLGFVEKIRSAIKICDKYTPWPTECYTKALTAKIMLKRRRLGSTLYFGFCKDDMGKLKGHAWLQCSGMIVTGFCDFSKYEVHSSFS